ncbi:hypothetical protein [Emticicia fontis]
MKTSNKLLIAFLGFLILTMIFTAFQLKAAYKKINLHDKFRNYDRIALNPVKYLIIEGSTKNKADLVDEFNVDCVPGNERTIFLPRNPFFREHLTYKQSGDTLKISSTLPYPYGLNIFLSGINPEKIEANAARVLLDGLTIDSLQVNLKKIAVVTISRTKIKECTINTTDKSFVRFAKNTSVGNLDMNLQKFSGIELGVMKLNKASLQMSSSARITATKEHLLLLQKSGGLQ